MNADELLSSAQAARHLGLAEQTLANWRASLKGPPYVKVGRFVRYRFGDLRRWVATQSVRPERGNEG